MGMLDFLYTPNLSKQDRQRVDSIIKTLQGFQDIVSSLRLNEEIVIRISLDRKRRGDDIRK